MLFLRSLESIQLAVEGTTTLELRRLSDGPDVIVQTNGDLRSWRRLERFVSSRSGCTESEVFGTRSRPSGRPKSSLRSASLTMNGLLFAWLPTQESSGLSCHIHADFFPTSDRKHLHWEADYRSEWNRVALRAAAKAIVSHVDESERLHWSQEILGALSSGEDHGGWNARTISGPSGRSCSRPFAAARACYTQRGEWVIPGDATVVDSSSRDCLAGDRRPRSQRSARGSGFRAQPSDG